MAEQRIVSILWGEGEDAEADEIDAVEVPWSDPDWRCFLPLRDLWPEGDVLVIRSTEILEEEEHEPDEVTSRARQHWGALPEVSAADLAGALQAAVASRSLVALHTSDGGADESTVGFVDSFDNGYLRCTLVDPEAHDDGPARIPLSDVIAVLLTSRYLDMLTLLFEPAAD